MSKHLVKIICICALALLVPLTIVGVALFVTEPVAVTLTVGEGGIDGEFSTSDITIKVEGEEVEETTIKVKKHSEITVSFSSKDANSIDTYDFKGWYNGTEEEINVESDTPVSFESSYTFTIRGNTTLTAMRDVFEYTVTYSGFLADGTTSVSTVLSETVKTYKYGEDLAEISDENGIFQGWNRVSSQGTAVDANLYTKAKFDTQEVTLEPAWENQMVIEYIKGTTPFATARVFESTASSYVLLNGDSTEVKSALTAGKSFAGWKDIDGEDVTSITYDINTPKIQLFMQEDLITYNLKVQYHAVSDETVDVTYDIDNGFSAIEYENATEYDNQIRWGYIFTGYDVNNDGEVDFTKSEGDYVNSTGEKLSNEIISGNIEDTIVAVWDCKYDSYKFYISGVCNYQREGSSAPADWGIYGDPVSGGDGVLMNKEFTAFFKDSNDANCYDLYDNIYNLMFDGYTLRTKEGDSVVYNTETKSGIYGTNKQVHTLNVVDTGTIDFATILGELDYNEYLEEDSQVVLKIYFRIV